MYNKVQACFRSKTFPLKNMLGLCYTFSLYIYTCTHTEAQTSIHDSIIFSFRLQSYHYHGSSSEGGARFFPCSGRQPSSLHLSRCLHPGFGEPFKQSRLFPVFTFADICLHFWFRVLIFLSTDFEMVSFCVCLVFIECRE